MPIQQKVEEIFALCAVGSNHVLYFTEVAQIFWPILDNHLTLCDLSGIFAVANPRGLDSLDLPLFREFLNSISRVKYPTEANHLGLVVEDLIQARSLKYHADNSTFKDSMDKNVMRILLKFDLPLRRAFSAFAGMGVKIGGGLTWDEVKKMDVGMDVEGFTSFAGACSLIPTHLTLQQCTSLARDILNRYPLLKSSPTLSSTLLYPQFQLLLCFASLVVESPSSNPSLPRNDKGLVAFGKSFSRNVSVSESKPISFCLSNLLGHLGIDIAGSMQAAAGTRSSTYRPTASLSITDQQDRDNSNSKLLPTVLLPSSSHPEDLYSRASQNGRESMVMRMEKIFDEVEARLASMAAAEEEEESPFDLDNFSSELEDSTSERRLRHLSKPVVIGDSIPPPLHCPPVVQHSLEAALAHHNLGSYEESLKYLETAKVQLYESERDKILQKKRHERKKLLSTTDKAENLDPSANIKIEVLDSEVSLPADVNFYVLACKGNVYQSCGDDEQSLLQYLSAWEAALVGQHHDWEMLFINSIGLLAYYNLHFELALRCFHKVSRYREREYGSRSADTATSWNNQGCCLYCLSRKGVARVLFERSRNVFYECLGSRHPRSVVSSKNCEKAKRSQTIVHDQNIKASIAMRPDANRLLIGKEITIQALPPLPGNAGGGSSKSKGGKKKK